MNACTHPRTGRVSTNPQGYTERPHAATSVCDLQECIEEALAWVTRVTFGLPAFHMRVLSAGGVFREGATPAIDRETLAAAAHKHYCVTPNEPTHEPDEIDYDKADEILEILALIGGAS